MNDLDSSDDDIYMDKSPTVVKPKVKKKVVKKKQSSLSSKTAASSSDAASPGTKKKKKKKKSVTAEGVEEEPSSPTKKTTKKKKPKKKSEVIDPEDEDQGAGEGDAAAGGTAAKKRGPSKSKTKSKASRSAAVEQDGDDDDDDDAGQPQQQEGSLSFAEHMKTKAILKQRQKEFSKRTSSLSSSEDQDDFSDVESEQVNLKYAKLFKSAGKNTADEQAQRARRREEAERRREEMQAQMDHYFEQEVAEAMKDDESAASNHSIASSHGSSSDAPHSPGTHRGAKRTAAKFIKKLSHGVEDTANATALAFIKKVKGKARLEDEIQGGIQAELDSDVSDASSASSKNENEDAAKLSPNSPRSPRRIPSLSPFSSPKSSGRKKSQEDGNDDEILNSSSHHQKTKNAAKKILTKVSSTVEGTAHATASLVMGKKKRNSVAEEESGGGAALDADQGKGKGPIEESQERSSLPPESSSDYELPMKGVDNKSSHSDDPVTNSPSKRKSLVDKIKLPHLHRRSRGDADRRGGDHHQTVAEDNNSSGDELASSNKPKQSKSRLSASSVLRKFAVGKHKDRQKSRSYSSDDNSVDELFDEDAKATGTAFMNKLKSKAGVSSSATTKESETAKDIEKDSGEELEQSATESTAPVKDDSASSPIQQQGNTPSIPKAGNMFLKKLKKAGKKKKQKQPKMIDEDAELEDGDDDAQSSSSSEASLDKTAILKTNLLFAKKLKKVAKKKLRESSGKDAYESSDDDDDIAAELSKLEMSVDIFNLGDDSSSSSGSDEVGDASVKSYPPWQEFMEHTEIFSKLYQPTKVQLAKMEPYFKALCASSWGFGRASIQATILSNLLDPEGPPPQSVLIRKGSIEYAGQPSELIVLTHGLLVLDRLDETEGSPGWFSSSSPSRTCHVGQLWSNFQNFFAPSGDTKIIFTDHENGQLDIEFESSEEQASFALLLEYIFIEHAIQYPESDRVDTSKLGWQYTKVYKPGYTGAVMNVPELLLDPSCDEVTYLDQYHQSTPLHYHLRIYHDEPELDLLEELLDAGADPNMEDGDGRSAMYFAQKHGWKDVQDLLEMFGGTPSNLLEAETRGELFGKAEESQAASKNRRDEKKQQQEEALAAKQAMSENTSLLQERGQKIEELGDKATELNEGAANFADMAAQLKAQVKDKKWYQL